MGKFLSGFVLPLFLLTAALVNWSLISLVDLVAFLFVQYSAPKTGFWFQRQSLISWYTLILSSFAILSHAIFHIVWIVKGDQWSISDAQWAKLIGFLRGQSRSFPSVTYFLVVQVLAAFVALFEICLSRFSMNLPRDSFLGHLYSFILRTGSNLRVLCCLLLPAVQLVVGISHPSWVSLPFFVCSSIGLVDWSLTSNFLGLFRSWRYLLLYSGLNIVLLYLYQLPIEFYGIVEWLAGFIGLYKISANSEWSEVCSCLSLVLFYIMLSWIRCDLIEMEFIMSARAGTLTEQLLPTKHSFFILESRSGVRHTNILLRGPILRTFGINFFTYGFPISFLALSFWSFHFASFCALGLIAYFGYVLYVFPTMYHLHRLNGLLLVFILLWAVSTYIFNIAFTTVLNKDNWEDMNIWETIGLWRYPIPGFYLLAQFGLGVLIALVNLVNNSVFLYLADREGPSSLDDSTLDESEETKVLIVATVVWGLRKTSLPMALFLLFLIALNPGFIHALYMVFFLIFLLSHNVDRKTRKCLILLCEAHFTLLYVLQLNLISTAMEKKGSIAGKVLSQLGSFSHANSGDFLKIVVLASFCAIHNHGFEMLLSFSAIVQQTPRPPIGFNILRAGLLKSAILSVYTRSPRLEQEINYSHERKIGSYLNAIGHKFLSMYRSCGTYIVILTILLTLYTVTPNYLSFGYLFFLLLWISGRQVAGKTVNSLWRPLKIYAIVVFVFIYGLSVFSSLQEWLSKKVDLSSAFGFDPEASMLENIWESLAVLIVMQLYSYERRQSIYFRERNDAPEVSACKYLKRLLIWHREKILYLTVFYASLSPISLFGFSYLFALVICSITSKTSDIPSKFFLVYSALLVMVEYPFQMWGSCAELFPGQKHSSVSFFLGLQVYEPGFWGVESGLRGKILVIVASLLRYNVSGWLQKMPCNFENGGWWEDSCAFFMLAENAQNKFTNFTRRRKCLDTNPLLGNKMEERSHSCPSLDTHFFQGTEDMGGGEGKHSSKCLLENSKDNHKWYRKQVHVLRKERLQMQKASLKIYMKFWIENMFSTFGLQINMAALLVASFAVLNAISLLYIASLVACILLSRKVIRKLWPMFVFLFASVFTLEYVTIWLNPTSWKHISPAKPEVLCKDCWRSSDLHYDYCKKCWLGFKVDDPRMLISYYAVFMFSCLKLHADRLSSLSGFQAYKQMISHSKYASGLIDLSFETKVLWTFLDYLRLYIYCHLLDLVLALILITGTLEYDILHLGYLGFALVFFRLRLQILKKKNSIFKFLRIYNFALIVLSLAYQSPFVGDSREGKLEKMDHVSKVIGLRKYKFHVTSRNALVEIVIFMLVALQSFMFSSLEFDYVSKYLEAEKFGALVREQEKRAAWKTAQLQHIRKTEEQKRMRNSQVEKIKAEMLNLQIHLLGRSTSGCAKTLAEGERKRNPSVSSNLAQHSFNTRDTDIMTNDLNLSLDLLYAHDMNDSPTSERTAMESRKQSTNSFSEIPELNDRAISDVALQEKPEAKGNPLKSAAQLIGVGVSQVQSLGNQAVLNLVSLLNIEHEKPDIADEFSDDEIYYEIENQDFGNEHLEQTQSTLSDSDRIMSNVSCLQIRMIFHHIWDQMRSNNDVVCYCCFILIFLWNFSLLSMVYLVALFFYALWVNTGPSNMFWVIILIYTEFCILLQYLYQIIIQNFGMIFEARLLREWGFPARKIMSSFVIGHWPLFLVYLFTLLQSAITARNDESAAATEFRFSTKRTMAARSFGFIQRIKGLLLTVTNGMKLLIKNLYRFWKSLAHGSETPPYFVQLSMEVNLPPEDSIQPETIESKMNKLLKIIHDRRCRDNHNKYPASRVRVQSIERSPENVNVALAVFEVLYTSPSGKSSFTEWKRSLTPAANVTSEILAAYHAGIFREIGFPYMILSVIGGGKKDIDLYAYVFCADLLVFFLVAIFYQSVIKNSSEILEVYQHEDQFPIEFVFILMVIFFLIVLDRIIYLCSFASGKVIFYIFTLVLFTYSVINYAWRMEPSDKHAGKFAIRAIYLTKLISLALQAIQIRFGIPHESNLYRQFLTSTISQTNFLGFRIYRALPFLYELRCVLDWSCTTTSLTMYDWLKLEDIHGSLFLVKCDAELNRAKHPQGQKQTKMTKFCNGICLFFILMCVIWAPMLMYSSGNPTNIANPIREANVRIDIQTSSGRLTLFETTLCEKISWTEVEGHIDHDPRGYLANYNEVDIQLICCQPDASNSWLVPSVVQARFIQSLQWSMDIVFSWKFRRDRPRGKEVVRHQLLVADQDLPTAAEVMQVLNGTSNSFRMLNIYPRYFRVTGSGDFRFLEEAVDLVSGDLVLNPGKPEWWSFYDLGASNVTGCGEFAGPMAIIVSEETPQGILGDTLSKFSIWGLYITFVLAVGRFIRLQCSDLRMRIQFENLPSCNRLLAICEDIYAARAEGELEVEEVLYWTLVSIYRSPHNLLEYTKPE